MRLISQNSEVDVPYENYSLDISKISTNGNFAVVAFLYDRTRLILGEYSTKEKALNAMKKMQTKYVEFGSSNNYFRFPSDKGGDYYN